MKRFTQLVRHLESQKGQAERLAAMIRYFREEEVENLPWALSLLLGKYPRRLTTLDQLAKWSLEVTGLPAWLLEESSRTCKDRTEAISLIVGNQTKSPGSELRDWLDRIDSCRSAPDATRREFVLQLWSRVSAEERYLLNRILCGTMRLKIPRHLVAQALADRLDSTAHHILLCLDLPWTAQGSDMDRIFPGERLHSNQWQPYPYMPVHAPPEGFVPQEDQEAWIAEWKYRGIRTQWVLRAGKLRVWTREILLPEGLGASLLENLPNLQEDLVLDAMLRPRKEGARLEDLVSKDPKRFPVQDQWQLVILDLLEWKGIDIRPLPWQERRKLLESAFPAADDPEGAILLSQVMAAAVPVEYQVPHEHEGLILKHRLSAYSLEAGDKGWFHAGKPGFALLSVLLYYQTVWEGGRHKVEFTFGFRSGTGFVTLAKSTEEFPEMDEVLEWCRSHTQEKFGPVRSVEPGLIFNLFIPRLLPSKRHRSGLKTEGRILLEYCRDLRVDQVPTLEDVRKLAGL